MSGLILMHIDDWGIRAYGGERFAESLRKLVEGTLAKGHNVYNFLNPEEPSDIFKPYGGQVIEVDYREFFGEDKKGNHHVQFFDGKRRVMDDEVELVEIAGWNRHTCIRLMQRLMDGDATELVIDSAEDLGWEEDLYQRVLNAKIPIKVLDAYTR